MASTLHRIQLDTLDWELAEVVSDSLGRKNTWPPSRKKWPSLRRPSLRVLPQPMSEYPGEWRRALEMLAKSGDGCTTLVLFAQGFPSTVIARCVDYGLVTATTERVLADQRSIDVTRVRITNAGRLALAR